MYQQSKHMTQVIQPMFMEEQFFKTHLIQKQPNGIIGIKDGKMQRPMIIMTMITKIQKSRFLCWLWARAYRKWLWNEFYENYDTVDKVIGWRTARTKTKGGTVKWIQPCFWIFD